MESFKGGYRILFLLKTNLDKRIDKNAASIIFEQILRYAWNINKEEHQKKYDPVLKELQRYTFRLAEWLSGPDHREICVWNDSRLYGKVSTGSIIYRDETKSWDLRFRCLTMRSENSKITFQ